MKAIGIIFLIEEAQEGIFRFTEEKNLMELDPDQSLPEIPEYPYDKPEDRLLLQRGAIIYSKMLASYRRVKL